jgi:Family of unknown function (DUF5681)
MPRNYDVGYGRPPSQSRFKPGQSGNPRGKAPGNKSFKTAFLNELTQPVMVEDQGRRRRMSRNEVLVKSLVNDALKGNHRARKLVFDTLAQLERSGTADHSQQKTMLTDEKVIASLKARLTREPSSKA